MNLNHFYRWFDHHRNQALHALIILGTMLVVAYLPLQVAVGSRLHLLVFLLFVGIAGVLVLLHYPFLGFYTLVIVSLVGNLGIATGSNTPINASVVVLMLLIGLWVLDMIVSRRIQFLSSRPLLPLVIFLVASTISFGFGQLNLLPVAGAPLKVQLTALAIFFLAAGTFMLVGHRLDLVHLERLTFLFLALGAIYIILRLVPSLNALAFRMVPREATGSIFWIWLMVIGFSQALLNKRMARVWRIALGFLVVLTFYLSFILDRYWTSGWFPALVGVAVVVVIAFPRLIVPMMLAGLTLAALNIEKILSVFMVGDNTAFAMDARREAWRIVLEIASVSPIFGVGPANYYWYASIFPILGYWVPFNSHQNYVDLLAQTGIAGTVAFLWFAAETGLLGIKLLASVPEGFPKAYVIGAIGGLAGTLVSGMLGDWFLPFIYNVGLAGFRCSLIAWFFLGGLVSLEAIFKPASARKDQEVFPLREPKRLSPIVDQ